jgi:hypothetical protein
MAPGIPMPGAGAASSCRIEAQKAISSLSQAKRTTLWCFLHVRPQYRGPKALPEYYPRAEPTNRGGETPLKEALRAFGMPHATPTHAVEIATTMPPLGRQLLAPL